jgi:pimeloyl-ACP methyl ester carboxylesterase
VRFLTGETMGQYDEEDYAIDKEMGWDKGKKPPSPRRSADYWHALLRTARASSPVFRAFGTLGRAIASVVFFPVISPLAYSRRFNPTGDMIVVKRPLVWRIADGILTRILLAPVILAIFMLAVVYASTHPRSVQALATPDSIGVYYRRVSLITSDQKMLGAWFLPPLRAEQVAMDPEILMRQKWPGVVLCHGLGSSQEQYLPLAKKLHDYGFAVLMVDMRGQGESDRAAVTYGLRERFDVLAGVKFLRESSYVDESKVCVVGHDIGAIAALQAATLDSSITAVVADGLWEKFEDRARAVFSQPLSSNGWSVGHLPTQWLAPLYTLTFEMAVRDQLVQMNPESVVRNIRTQPVLFVARTGGEYAPVQEVLTLAADVAGTHEVLVDKPGERVEDHIAAFLMKATGWKGLRHQPSAEVQEMLKNQVK